MEPVHRMTVEARTDHEVLLACPHESCGRRVVLSRDGDLVVIDRGDFFARHVGSVGPVEMSVGLTAPDRPLNS
jgi:hypothetical protein